MTDLARFSQALAPLLPGVRDDDFPGRLIGLLRDLVPFDEATIIVYRNARLPVIDFALPGSWQQPNLEIFLKGAFLLDPYYLAAAKQHRSGFFRLRDLAPAGFRQSEYYRIYYSNSGLRDECGYLVRLGNGGFLNIALGLTRRKSYTKRQLQLFAEVTPVVDMLCHQHWDAPASLRDNESDLRASLEAALASFGESKLTKREREVVKRILLGHTTKTVAEELSISFETVKLHRKHAYAKLGVGSQSELFYIFIDSLMHARHYHGGDPLSDYRQAPADSVRGPGQAT